MEYAISKAQWDDLPRIEEIYAYARQFMAETGNPNQWGKHHPPISRLKLDIEQGDLYVVMDNKGIHGVFYFFIGPDATYEVIENGAWHSDTLYGTVHRIASDGSGGIFGAAVEFCKAQIRHLRIDTHDDNKIMQHTVEKHGFRKCGIIKTDDGTPRIAYELILP